MTLRRSFAHCLMGLLAIWAALSPRTARADLTGSYMTRQTNWLAYLRLTETKHNITGYALWVAADTKAGTQMRKTEVRGTVQHNNIAIKLDSFFGTGGIDATGKQSRGSLTLEFPSATGAIQLLTFTPTTTQQWNSALTAFRTHWNHVAATARAKNDVAVYRSNLTKKEQETTLDVFRQQGGLANQLGTLVKANAILTRLEAQKASLQRAYEDRKAAADKATASATTDEEKQRAEGLQQQAEGAKQQISGPDFDIASIKQDITNLHEAIKRNKATIQQAVQQIRTLQAEMKRNQMQFSPAPELGRFMATVQAPSVKIREAHAQTSHVFTEVTKDTWLGVIGTTDVDTFVMLPDGRNGVANKSDLRLIDLQQAGTPP